MMLIDRNAIGTGERRVDLKVIGNELPLSRCSGCLCLLRVWQRPSMHTLLVGNEDTIMIVIDRNAPWKAIITRSGYAELATVRAIIRRERLHSLIATVDHIQEASTMFERQASWIVECVFPVTKIRSTERILDSWVEVHRCEDAGVCGSEQVKK